MSSILGVEIGTERKKEIFDFVDEALGGDKQKYIVTLNPEILLKAEGNENYRNILNRADLKLIDGFGIKLVSWIKKLKTGGRIAGVDLAEYIVKKSKENNYKIGIVIRKDGLSSREEAENFFKDYNNFEIIEIGTEKNYHLNGIYNGRIDVLIVCLGAPYQEKFIWQARKQNMYARLAIGAGGTIDFWTGKQKRAPKWMQEAGLEWLWRFLNQPNRFFRMFNATVVFLWKSIVN